MQFLSQHYCKYSNMEHLTCLPPVATAVFSYHVVNTQKLLWSHPLICGVNFSVNVSSHMSFITSLFLLAAPLWNGPTSFRSCWSIRHLRSTLPVWNGLQKSSLYHQWKANGIVVSLWTEGQSGCVTLSRQEKVAKVRSGVWFLPRFPARLIPFATTPEQRYYQSI